MKISDNVVDGMLSLYIWKFVFLLHILCQQRCKQDVSKSVIAMRFTVEDNI